MQTGCLGGIAVSRFLGKEEVAGSIPARGLLFGRFLRIGGHIATY